MPRRAAPEAAVVPCPDCGEEQVHDVLQAAGAAGDATVRCRECGRVHRAVLPAPKLVDVPVIVSSGQQSERLLVSLPADEELALEDEMVAGDKQVQVRALDRRDGKRVRRAKAEQVATIWAVDWEQFAVKFSVNMGHKTISKSVQVSPHDTFNVGDELDLDRLRIYIHAIKTREGTLHAGSAEAKDIVRIFGRPLRLGAEERRARRAELGLPEPKRRVRQQRRQGKVPSGTGPAPRPRRRTRRGSDENR
jgi:uncharacterized Zn finger protein